MRKGRIHPVAPGSLNAAPGSGWRKRFLGARQPVGDRLPALHRFQVAARAGRMQARLRYAFFERGKHAGSGHRRLPEDADR